MDRIASVRGRSLSGTTLTVCYLAYWFSAIQGEGQSTFPEVAEDFTRAHFWFL